MPRLGTANAGVAERPKAEDSRTALEGVTRFKSWPRHLNRLRQGLKRTGETTPPVHKARLEAHSCAGYTSRRKGSFGVSGGGEP